MVLISLWWQSTIAGAAGLHMDTCTCIDQLWPLLSGTYAYNSHVHSPSYLEKFVGQMPTCRLLVPVRLQRYITCSSYFECSWPCKCRNVEDTNQEQPTSSMVPLLVFLPDSQFLCWSYSVMDASTCRKDGESTPSVHAIMSCICPAEHMVCCQCATHHVDHAGLLHWTHNSCVVYVFVLYVSYSVAWSLSHILIPVMCMQLLRVLYVYSVMLAPQFNGFF